MSYKWIQTFTTVQFTSSLKVLWAVIARLPDTPPLGEFPAHTSLTEGGQVRQSPTRSLVASEQRGGKVRERSKTEGRRGLKKFSRKWSGISLVRMNKRLKMSSAIGRTSGSGYWWITWAASWIPNCCVWGRGAWWLTYVHTYYINMFVLCAKNECTFLFIDPNLLRGYLKEMSWK